MLARKRVAEPRLTGSVEIRVQDYRGVEDGPFDAISSIGMAEHVGQVGMPGYTAPLQALLRPGGRLLPHAITWAGGDAHDATTPSSPGTCSPMASWSASATPSTP